MKTLGIDLASDPAGTAGCLVDWSRGGAEVEELWVGADDDLLLEAHARADVTGIDAPFGWPTAFMAFLCSTSRPTGEALPAWSPRYRDDLRFRATDLHTRGAFGRWPLSVSSDLVAVPAFRCQGLLASMGVTDRSGDGRVYEVYPAAALARWGFPSTSYKKGSGRKRRETIVAGLRRRTRAWLRVSSADARAMGGSDDALDAFLAALVARAAALGLTARPPAELQRDAAREGWIAVPEEGSLERLAGKK